MPLYNYVCLSHGEFDCWRPMSESDEPSPCPACGESAPRAISAPSLALMNSITRKAHSINERSADQPVMETRTPAGERKTDHVCGHGCSHSQGKSRHRHGPSRPWMIGH